MQSRHSGCRGCTPGGEARLEREEVWGKALHGLTQPYGAVDILVVLGQRWAGDHIYGDARSEGRGYLLVEEATLSALLGDDGVGLYAVEELLVLPWLEVDDMVEGEACRLCLLPRVLSVEDAEVALVARPEGLEGSDGIDTRQRKESMAGLRLELGDHLLIAGALDDLPRTLAVAPLVADDGDTELGRHFTDRLVEDSSKGVRCIYDELYLLLGDELAHHLMRHRARDTLAVHHLELLEGSLSRVVVVFTRLVEDATYDASLCRATEDKYHYSYSLLLA